MKVVLIRHTSVDVPPGVCYGQSDVPLADTFVDEAFLVKEKLSKYNFHNIFTSPLTRCRKLAEFCGYENAVVDSRLMEMNFGKWEMMPYDEIDDPRLQLWYDDYQNVAPTGGESSLMQRLRFVDFLKTLDCKSDKNIALFTHGGIIIHALVLLGGLSYQEAYSLNPPYGAVVELNM